MIMAKNQKETKGPKTFKKVEGSTFTTESRPENHSDTPEPDEDMVNQELEQVKANQRKNKFEGAILPVENAEEYLDPKKTKEEK
jgi:hypothetical protein